MVQGDQLCAAILSAQARKDRVPGGPGFRRNGRVEFSFLVCTISKNAVGGKNEWQVIDRAALIDCWH